MSDPFQRLQELDRLCSDKAELLPSLQSHEHDWSGIGFSIGGADFLTTMGEVSEILDLPDYTKVPGVKPWVVGIANVRGSLLPLIDLKGFISGDCLHNFRNCRVLVVNNTGLLVEKVLGMRNFSLNEQVYELPDLDMILRPYIARAFLREDKYWPVFSFNVLVDDERFLHAAL